MAPTTNSRAVVCVRWNCGSGGPSLELVPASSHTWLRVRDARPKPKLGFGLVTAAGSHLNQFSRKADGVALMAPAARVVQANLALAGCAYVRAFVARPRWRLVDGLLDPRSVNHHDRRYWDPCRRLLDIRDVGCRPLPMLD
jgi:hypothetical protein